MSEPTIIDTSVWIDVLRDGDGGKRRSLESEVDLEDMRLTRFTQLELLQGCRDQREWDLLSRYLDVQEYVEAARETWSKAARIFFDLRRAGRTVRSPIDCCIAQSALDGGLRLLHRDRDFVEIAAVRPKLRHRFLDWP